MAESGVEIKFNPPDLLRRMQAYPKQLDKAVKKAAEASLVVLHENVPPYPPELPNQRYRRQGILGKSLGVGMTGGKFGRPSIYTVRKQGGGYEGKFGSNLEYAADVIGSGRQKKMFRGRWWTEKTIARRSVKKIVKLYEILTVEMAKFLDGKR